MALNRQYILAYSFEQYFVDKDTGAPLAGGKISFYQDSDQITPKLVYQLVGGPPYDDASYVSLGDSVTLSSVGTPQDDNGNNISIYFYPYDTNGNLQLYYISVENSLGVPQFTRQAQPNITPQTDPATLPAYVTNALSNSQFVEVLFEPSLGMTITTAAAGTSVTTIAPDWDLLLTCGAATTVTISRTAVQGQLVYPNNPPYILNFVPGANITALTLRQRLFHNPGIWSPQVADNGGYVAGSMMLGAGTQALMIYAPSTGGVPAQRQIVTGNNTSGLPVQFSGSVELPPSTNPDTSSAGYIDILIQLPVTGESSISNIQAVGLATQEQNLIYDQQPVNRQEDYLFHYYRPRLSYRPVPSYLSGWDFPLNPAQILGDTVATQAVGNAKSFYAWDQTIVYQSLNSGVSISRGPNRELVLTCAVANTQCAIIQYVFGTRAREMLNSRMSVGIESKTSNGAGIAATISLLYTAGTPLPVLTPGTNNSVVSTLSATGAVQTANNPTGGTWSSLSRSNLGPAQFTVIPNATTNFNFNGFSGWNAGGINSTTTVNWLAVVIGFGPMNVGDAISINSVGLVPGDIPCRPAPQSTLQVLNECRHYYSKSYNNNVLPGTATTVGQKITPTGYGFGFPSVAATAGYSQSFELDFMSTMRVVPTLNIYSPVSGTLGNINWVIYASGAQVNTADVVMTTYYNAPILSVNNAVFIGPGTHFGDGVIGYASGESHITYHYVADARPGLV